MPHAGLMDEHAMGPEKGPLQRARLHIRGGRRRLRQGKISPGIVTLYDALSAALEWYFASPQRREGLIIEESDDLKDEKTLYAILRRSGVLNADLDYGAFDKLVEKVLYADFSGYDHDEILRRIESVMLQLGVMPFDEADLPPEDPSTF